MYIGAPDRYGGGFRLHSVFYGLFERAHGQFDIFSFTNVVGDDFVVVQVLIADKYSCWPLKIKYVMSVTHFSFGFDAWNSRFR